MKYTIIDPDKRAPFIQQNYDTLKEANERLDVLKRKFADRPLVVVGIDDDGNFHELASAPTPLETDPPVRQRQHRRQ